MPKSFNLRDHQKKTFSLVRSVKSPKDLNLFSTQSDLLYPVRERVEIYRYAYRARLEDALNEDFVFLKRKTGQRDFSRLVSSFIDKEGSTSFTLNALGYFFLKFLEKSKHPQLKWARLDWTIAEAVFWKHIHNPQMVKFPTQTWGVVRTSNGVFFRRLTKPEGLILQGLKKKPKDPLPYLAEILQKNRVTRAKSKFAISCLVRDGFISGKMTPKR